MYLGFFQIFKNICGIIRAERPENQSWGFDDHVCFLWFSGDPWLVNLSREKSLNRLFLKLILPSFRCFSIFGAPFLNLQGGEPAMPEKLPRRKLTIQISVHIPYPSALTFGIPAPLSGQFPAAET
jgi:hypothetical protein